MKKTIYTLVALVLSFAATAQTISTVAGTGGMSGFAGDDGAATAAKLLDPGTSVVDAAGNIYIADKDNNRIRKVSTSGIITTVVGTGVAGSSGDDGAATAAQLSTPLSVALDAAGNLYIADFGNYRIRKVNTSGIITTVAGTTAGYAGDFAAATAAKLNLVTDVAVDAAGNIYICDYGNSRIRKVNTSGIITTIAGTGTNGYNGEGGAAGARLNSPNGVCVDASGNVYVADMNNARVRMITPGGTISTIAGTGTSGYTGDNGAATAAQINKPAFVTTDIAGNVFFSDMYNEVVRRIGVSGTINTVAGNATAGYSGDGGSATAANLNLPTGVTFDADNNLYITEQGNHTVRKVDVTYYPLSGTSTVCTGAVTSLSSFVMDGKWTSANTAKATVNATGDVTGVAAGTVMISYSEGLAVGTATVTVSPPANAGTIAGTNNVCQGSSLTLGTSGVSGGAWTSSNPTVATVSVAGSVTGVTAGATTISYMVTVCGSSTGTFPFTVNACVAGVNVSEEQNASITVYPNPAASGSISISLPVYDGLPVSVIMTNSMGQKVKEIETAANGPIIMNVDTPSGIYFLSVISGNNNYQAKVLIKK